jgi:uncharacterized membrane protein YoaK (UPF0700 family)
MAEEKICQGCNQKSKCEEVYRRLGSLEGPSVAWKAVVAFLLPIVVFVAALAAIEAVLAEEIESQAARTAVGFALALCASVICVLITRTIDRQFGKGR